MSDDPVIDLLNNKILALEEAVKDRDRDRRSIVNRIQYFKSKIKVLLYQYTREDVGGDQKFKLKNEIEKVIDEL